MNDGHIRDKLFPFQTRDLEFLLAHPRCINGNQMGLGKTIETLALVEELERRGETLEHILIICPKTLITEWWYQIDEWMDRPCLTPHDQGDRLIGLNLSGPQFVCINYDLLTTPRYLAQLLSVKWDMIVFDECHRLKNHETKRTASAFLLVPGVERVNLLSGTPMQNSPADLWSLFHIIEPSRWLRHRDFVKQYCYTVPMEVWVTGKDGQKHRRVFNQIVGAKNQEELREILAQQMVRNEKKDVLKDLPDKQYRTVPVQLGRERAQYDQMEKELFALLDSGELITAPAVIAQLTRLRQICLDPNLLSHELPKKSTPSNKTQAVMELIEGTDDKEYLSQIVGRLQHSRGGGTKIVIYTWFEQYTRLLAAELEKREIPYVLVTGQVPMTERGNAVYRFQNDPECKVCLGTVGAMGEGITLTASHTVIFTDLAWNPAVNTQAEDRLHRIGQKDSVLVIDLWCESTVEDHVHKVVRRKEQWFNEIVATKSVIDSMRATRSAELEEARTQ